MIPLTLTLLSSLGSLTLAAPPHPNTETESCTREVLKAHTETLLAAQSSGNPAALVSLQSPTEFIYTEDFKTRPSLTTDSILTFAQVIDHSRSLLDTTQCATYTEIISASSKTPRVIGTQMRFDATGSRLIKMETLVTQQGDWLFNASATLRYARQEDTLWTAIPQSERDSRAVIQAAGDAYLDLFNNKSVTVPWGTPCQRLEGGAYTGRGSPSDSCNVGIPSGVAITNRRYVIDEVLGSVDAFVSFATRPDSHEFRVEKGKLRLVHTLTVMRNLN